MSSTHKSTRKDRPLHEILPLRELSFQVQEARLARDMTQKELSDRTGINIRTIYRIEQCHRIPTKRTIHALCRILQDDPREWLELLRYADAVVRKAGGLDAFDEL